MKTGTTAVFILFLGTMAISAEPASGPRILLLRKIQTGESVWSSQTVIDGFVNKFRNRLTDAGLDSHAVDDIRLRPDDLTETDLVVLPYNPETPPSVTAQLRDFTARGGRLFLLYSSDPELLQMIGIRTVRFRKGDDLPKLKGISLVDARIQGTPEFLAQASWNIQEPIALERETSVIGTWIDENDQDTHIPALTRNPNGFFMTHVYLDENPEAGRRLLRALIGALFPDMWLNAARDRLDRLTENLGATDLNALRKRAAESGDANAMDAVAKAIRLGNDARDLLETGKGFDALLEAERARDAAVVSSLAVNPSRSGEMRGAWIHSAYGLEDWGWDRTVRVLAEHGFNAIFPNLCWGAVADYPSTVLPVHPKVAAAGDQIQLCLAACRKYGVEMHVWKVNWNMGHHTPAEIRQIFVDAGRTQVDLDGKPSQFLAPHLEENFLMEHDAMLEIVRNYPVDGIHFDYIRYPGEDCDFSQSARLAFEKALGKSVTVWPDDARPGGRLRAEYNAWRRDNITRLVRSVSRDARQIRPGIAVSAAVFGAWETAPESVAQATVEWIHEGLLDFVCPMDYTNSADELERLLRAQLAETAGRIPLYAGIGSWKHADSTQTISQIQLARALGADGFVCFCLNRRFAQETLPDLACGVTRLSPYPMPHDAPLPDFRLPEGEADLGGAVRLWSNLEISSDTAAPGRRTYEVSLIRNGFPEHPRAMQVSSRHGRIIVRFRPEQAGTYQLELRTPPEPGRGPESGGVARSPVIEVLGETEVRERLRMSGPPEFANNGAVKVAILANDAYGSGPLLETLSRDKKLDVAPLFNLKSSSLATCDVVLLMQPRRDLGGFRNEQTRKSLAEYVKAGGSLMCMHAMVGIRGFPSVIPGIATGGTRLPGSDWQAVRKHALTRDLTTAVHQATFPDRISVVPGKKGMSVIATAAGEPLVVVGRHGKGRLVSCGLGIAIGKGDEDVVPSEMEQRLVRNAIAWLAE